MDTDSIKKAVRGSPVVLNCIGPFYRYGPGVLRATINSHVNYVDTCDDFDATEEMLAMDKDARKTGGFRSQNETPAICASPSW